MSVDDLIPYTSMYISIFRGHFQKEIEENVNSGIVP